MIDVLPRAVDIIRRSGVEDGERLVAELERRLYPSQMTLGGLIKALGALPADELVRPITFEMPWLYPTHFNSYRGYYNQLALGVAWLTYLGDRAPIKAGEALLKEARSTVGQEFTGWRGGDYTMTERTPVWIDNPGECNSMMLVGVRSSMHGGVLLIRRNEEQ